MFKLRAGTRFDPGLRAEPVTGAYHRSARDLLKIGFPSLILTAGPVPALLAEGRQYTWSLTIFAVPATLLLFWLLLSPEPRRSTNTRSITVSLVILVPLALVLDLLLGDEFFLFRNREAVMGVYLPALDLFRVDHTGAIPIEELLFFVCGFLFILLVYTWSDQSLFVSREQPRRTWPLACSLLPALVPLCGVILWIAALLGALIPAPGYLIYLLVVPSGVAAALLPRVAHRTNWPAFTFTAATVFWISIVWEVGLAVPQGWWGYRPEAMVGVFIGTDLPVEAALVWVLAPLTSVLVLEAVRARGAVSS